MNYSIICPGKDVKKYPRCAILFLNLTQYFKLLVVKSNDTYYNE